MNKVRISFLVILLAWSLCGCGQRGPLYLPESPPPAPEQPAIEESESDEENNANGG